MDTIEKLGQLRSEAEEHVKRLDERAKNLLKRAKEETDPFKKELLTIAADSVREQVDTGLDFMLSLIGVVGEGFASVGEDGEEVVGIEPEDAKRILEVVSEHIALLTSMRAMSNATPDEIANIDEKIAKAKGVLARVEELELDPADEEGDDDGEGEEEEDGDDGDDES